MLKKLRTYVTNLPVVQKSIAFSQKLVLPGFDRIPLYDVLRFFVKAVSKGMISTRASAVAFSFFLALFPAIIFLVSLLPFLPMEDFHTELLVSLQEILPDDAFELVSGTINDFMDKPRGSVLSFGFLLTIYFASNGIARMIGAFNQSIYAVEKRSVIVQRLVAFALLFILTLLVVAAVGLIVFKDLILSYLIAEHIIESTFVVFLVNAANWLIILSLFYFSVSFVYFLGPAGISKWRFFSAGSTFATIALIVVSLAFAWYVNNFGRFNTIYGSIGSLIVVMLWMNYVALILIAGFELNASIRSAPGQEENTLTDP